MILFQKKNAITITEKENFLLLVNTIPRMKILFSQKIKI